MLCPILSIISARVTWIWDTANQKPRDERKMKRYFLRQNSENCNVNLFSISQKTPKSCICVYKVPFSAHCMNLWEKMKYFLHRQLGSIMAEKLDVGSLWRCQGRHVLHLIGFLSRLNVYWSHRSHPSSIRQETSLKLLGLDQEMIIRYHPPWLPQTLPPSKLRNLPQKPRK